MTREELLARLVAIANERPFAPIGHVVENELPELRAQAEAINGAAHAARASAPDKSASGLEAPAAAPPSVEPVAWNHACNALCTHIDLWIPQCPHCGKPRTAPPDLAARVKSMKHALKVAKGALGDCMPCAEPECKASQVESIEIAMRCIDAALAREEK